MPDYKTAWKPNDRNEAFWYEALVGRTIVSLSFDADDTITEVALDSGEKLLFTAESPITIQTEE